MMWLVKQRLFIDFTLASLWRRRWKNTALLVVYSLEVFLIASVIFFARAIREEATTILQDAPQVIVQRVMGGRHQVIPEAYARQIAEIRGVRSVRPRLWGYYHHPAAGANYTIMTPEKFPHTDDSVVVGAGVLRSWGTLEADGMYFKSYDGQPIVLKVADTFDGATELVSSDLILMAESIFRRISGVPRGFATDLAANVANERECPIIAEKIVRQFPDTRVILREDILRTYATLFDWRSGYSIVLLAGAVFAFFIFAWDKATGLSADEKAEIGILKGVGWDTGDILAMKFWEGSLISVTAFLVGVIGAYIHIFLGSAVLFDHALKGWSVLYPNFTLKPILDPSQLSILFFLTVVPYTLITLVPTWAVSVTDPDSVMRS